MFEKSGVSVEYFCTPVDARIIGLENNIHYCFIRGYRDTEPYTKEEIRSFVAKAKEIIPSKVEFFADKIGVTYNRITIRCQRTRWGSCSSKGNLNFNCLLILLPDEIIDSVIVHELCHRKQMNHSAKFYAEIEKVYPDYKRCNAWLKQNGNKYMSRIPK